MALSTRTAGLTLAVALSAPLGATPASAVSGPGPRTGTVAHAERVQAHPVSKSQRKHHSRWSFGERAVRLAARYQGVPYRSGGTSPRGFDCSGFARFIYGRLDKHIPRSSQQQYDAAHRVRTPHVGDLIFFHSGSGGSVYHVGIYAGQGKIWHSPRPGESVRKERIWTRYWTSGRF